MTADCEICEIQARPPADDVRVFETAFWRVTLASDPEWIDLQAVMARYEMMVRRAFGADLFNWACLLNDTFKQAKPKPHVHWHVRPRYASPPTVAGWTFADPNFAHHYSRQVRQLIDRGVREQIAAAMTAA
jgi:diadenosine tetraphosphate (Ap4A) HIT family hydrolase